ncbi:uncharacterized protein LOC127774584 [Oryza glaberrima]|uniref:uncharacterized protein LOC127774584 n=1 Tax=Oryza glaberrima TaxID=4538 RepID=UPI00023E2AC6|nr:uncharacterized protein LOC127774584 [Oryza glaberrima]
MAIAQSSPKEEQHQQCHGGRGGWVFQAIAMLVATAVTTQAAYRARWEPWDLAFVLFSYADLGLLFLCLSVYERLPPPPLEEVQEGDSGDDGAAVRWRLKMAVWALSTALSVAFAWRVAAVMPAPAMKAALWGMTSTVAVAGFYLLFVYRPVTISSSSEMDTCKHKQSSPKLDQMV